MTKRAPGGQEDADCEEGTGCPGGRRVAKRAPGGHKGDECEEDAEWMTGCRTGNYDSAAGKKSANWPKGRGLASRELNV